MFNLAPLHMVIAGLLTGIVFGWLLQRARVSRYQVILGQFLFKDFTVLKVMLTAIVVGAIGIWAMRSMGMNVPLHVKSATLVPNVLGGLIFGVGMALLGYCPGTGAAALGDGSRHAWFGLAGMVVGGAAYAETFPFFKDTLAKMGSVSVDGSNKITFNQLTGLSPWWFILALAIVAIVVFVLVERSERRIRS